MPQYIIIIKDTPIWVWILLIFLIMRGINALSDREMSIERIFLLPTVFLFWGSHSVLTETYFSYLSFIMMITGLVSGITIGWILWRSQPRLREKPESTLIIRPGTPLTLIMISITFVSKFIMTTLLSISPMFLHSLYYNLLFGLVSGLLDGIFWGGAMNLFISWYKNKKI
ncbi:DUF6622 family protein [Xenorhabdus siamensis]|uniref:DUF6622 family protein n=1 Tax=Xenorhabdus siamensis TaxID=3136254 RepID=UPI0030F470D5